MTEDINILDELKLLNSEILINTEKGNIYFLPEEFFDTFPSDIKRQIWINSVSKKNLYSVPDGYFENLSEIILDKLWLTNNSASNRNYYFLPEDYFESLADNIIKKILHKEDDVRQELKELSPLLSNIPKDNVFSVPSGYFDALIPTAQRSDQSAKIKIISFRSKARKWISYAAAACIAGLMFMGGYFYLQNKNIRHFTNSKNQFTNVNVKQAISQLSDAEINSYLNNDNSDFYSNTNPASDSDNLDIKIMIDNTPDEEINKYLLENSEPAEKNSGI